MRKAAAYVVLGIATIGLLPLIVTYAAVVVTDWAVCEIFGRSRQFYWPWEVSPHPPQHRRHGGADEVVDEFSELPTIRLRGEL